MARPSRRRTPARRPRCTTSLSGNITWTIEHDPAATTNDEHADAEEDDTPGVSRRPGGPAGGPGTCAGVSNRRACKTPTPQRRGVAPRSAPAHNPSAPVITPSDWVGFGHMRVG